MKSAVRVSLMIAVLLMPVFAFAQPYTGSYNYSGQQYFSGGVYGGQGFGGGNGGFGGGGIFPGMGGFGGGFGGPVGGIAGNIIFIINTVLVPLLFAVSFIVFLYGIAKSYIFSTGDEEGVKKGHHIILWGLIAFAVMVSVWGLVNVVAATFGLTGAFAPPFPSSYSPFMGGAPLPPPPAR